MRALVVACLAVLSAALFAVLPLSPASAAERLAAGSWADSCPNGSVSGFTLTADCLDGAGALHTTSLSLLSCGQPPAAGNANGRLVCESGPRSLAVPGSWSSSCGNDLLAGQSLKAICLDGAGQKVSAFLDLSTCARPLRAGNQNGRLVCESGLAQAAPTSRTTILHLNPPPPAGPPPVLRLPLPVPGIVLNVPGQAASAGPSFAGAWNVTTNAGERFQLLLNQNGAAVTGSADVNGTHVILSGNAVGGRLDATWVIGTPSGGRLTGAGVFDLSPDGSQLTGALRIGSQVANNASWVGVRGSGASSVVLAPPGAANLPAMTTTNSADGPVRATVRSSVSIRTAPTMKGSDILGTLLQGTEVTVECQKSWCALSTGEGFVSKGFLTLHGPAASTNTAASTGAAMPSNETRVAVGQVAPPSAAAPVAVDSFVGSGCSPRPPSVDLGGAKVTLMFHNASSATRHLFWINRNGERVPYQIIPPGGTVPQETFNGHVWELTDEDGQCKTFFTAGTISQTLETH
ncbi:MAG: hypothetical protein WDM94_02460 [Bauldia sp.]